MQCIIGSAWRHYARGMWAPTLDQARRTHVHLCRLIVRVVLAVPATAPIELTGDSGTAPELLALPIAAGGFAMPLFVERFFLRPGGQHHSRLGPAFYLYRLLKDGWLPPQPRARAWSTQPGLSRDLPGGRSLCGRRSGPTDRAHEPLRPTFETPQRKPALTPSNAQSRSSRAASHSRASPSSFKKIGVPPSSCTTAPRRRKQQFFHVRLQLRTQQWQPS